MAFTGNEAVLYEKRDGKAYITINRPEAMNSLNNAVREGMRGALIDLRDDPAVFCGIVTGAGGRAFSAGIDLKERTQMDQQGGPAAGGAGGGGGDGRWTEMGVWKPMIAAIDGYCLAGGFEVSLQCDFRICTEQSRFGLPEPRRSLLAGYGLHNLSRMIPLGCALYIQLTGNHITSDTAAKWGIVQEVVSDRAALMTRVDEIAENIAECAPLAVQFIKRIVMQGRNMPVEYSMKIAQPWNDIINKSEDRFEGPKAFAEKRKAQWKGR